MGPDAALVLTRRTALAGLGAALPAVALAKPRAAHGDPRVERIEARLGGRIGLSALDVATGRRIEHRAGERFPMCSTFKLMAVAGLLARVDAGRERLDRFVRYGAADLLDYAPVARTHLAEGGLTLDALCAAAVELSDNTAANLILAALGGPGGVTRYARGLGDGVTRLDRREPELNEALPGDPRDTTTPAAMLGDMRAVLLGDALSKSSRERLIGWLLANQTGGRRLRARAPASWRIGDKTGSGSRGSTNDIAVMWPPSGRPILAAAYLTGSAAPAEDREAALADIGALIVEAFGG